MLGSNPGLLRLRHWQSNALSTRLDLIITRLDLISCVNKFVTGGGGGGDQGPKTDKNLPSSTFTGPFLRKVDNKDLVSLYVDIWSMVLRNSTALPCALF